MKKLVIAIVIIGLGIFGFVIFKSSTDFDLIYRYGRGAKNELNTFNQTYTKDMVNRPSVRVKMKLSYSELNDIRQRLDELDFFNEVTSFNEALKKENEEIKKRGGMPLWRSHCSSFYLKVRIKSEIKEINWNDCGKTSDKATRFSLYMNRIIESQKEYKKLPTPTAMYF